MSTSSDTVVPDRSNPSLDGPPDRSVEGADEGPIAGPEVTPGAGSADPGVGPGADAGGTGGSGGSGGSGGEDQPESTPATPRYEPMSVRGPALIVLGLAVFILIGGVVASAINSGSNPSFTLRQVVLPDGTTVALSPGTVKLHSIVSNDQPPADILGNIGAPKESRVTGVVNSDQNTAQFDRTVDLTSQLSQDQVVSVFTTMLKDVGWQVIYSGAAPQGTAGSTEVLAKRGSGDGFYWETGVVVSPTTPAGATPYSVEVIQTPDGN